VGFKSLWAVNCLYIVLHGAFIQAMSVDLENVEVGLTFSFLSASSSFS